MSVVLAADLGGTSLRVAHVARSGKVVRLAWRAHDVGVEADANSWWAELAACIRELGTDGVRGIALGGFTRSQILVDAAGEPVRPAQCFPDGRAEPVPGADAGTWMAMTPFHPVARLAWVARHDPAALARARHMLQPKDFLILRLTGRAIGDRVSNAWAIARDGLAVTGAPLRAAGLDPALLPDLLDPAERAGTARGLGLDGIPVFAGAMDTWMATLGAGIFRPGDAYVVSGTTDAGGVLTDSPTPRPGLSCLPWSDGVFHTGGPSGAGADALGWAATLLGLSGPGAVPVLAAEARLDAPPLLFLPALSGTRAPTWNAGARAALLGLDRTHGPAEIARAVLEGVAFADRDLHGGLAHDRVVITGGGARSDLWCQIRADILGRPLLRAGEETGLIGAAALAWTGLGAYPDLSTAQATMCRHDRRFMPNATPRLERLYDAYLRAQAVADMLAGIA